MYARIMKAANPQPKVKMSPTNGGFDYMGGVKPSDIGLKNSPKLRAPKPKAPKVKSKYSRITPHTAAAVSVK